MKKYFLILIAVFAYAKTYNVNTLEQLQNSFADIANLNEDATIYLASKEYELNSTIVYIDDVNKKITIEANNSTIISKNIQPFFIDNNQSTIEFDNITIKNGENNESGGAIYSSGDLIIKNSIFKNNRSISGGAISANSIEIIDSKFINNSSVYGGAIDCIGSVNIKDSIFKKNSAKYGGAMVANTIEVDNSYFTKNSADYGGALSADDSINVSNSYFKSNSAIYGGALSFANNGTIKKSIFKDNFATYAGAIIADSGTNIINSVFLNNRAKYGGAISIDNVNINHSTFINNFASSYASAFYGSGTIKNSIFTDFLDEIVQDGDVNIQNSIIDINKIYKDTYTLNSNNIYNYSYNDLHFTKGFRLSSNSLAINKAAATDVTDDIDGNPRDSYPDIGASEYSSDYESDSNAQKRIFIDSLSSGWSLVSFNEDTYPQSKIFNNSKVVWIYRNGKWLSYSKDTNVKNALQSNSIPYINVIKNGEGFWILK